MYKNLLSLVGILVLLTSCRNSAPQIIAVCEENSVGNHIVKWEITPPIEGNVKVFASANPNQISEESAVAMAPISDQRLTVVSPDPTQRYYYTLVFADKYRIKLASRNVKLPGVQNFRDLGGYNSYPTKKETRWGMLYRSAKLERLRPSAQRELKNIGIKTIIDLRAPSERKDTTHWEKNFNVVRLPVAIYDIEKMLKEISDPHFNGDTIYQVIERMNHSLVNNYIAEYRRIFDVLLDEANYPVVIECTSGKGRTGVVTALILSVLGVNDDTIIQDYRLSNEYFNIAKAQKDAYKLPVNTQEAITAIFSAREDYLKAAKTEIDQRYGSVDAYLQKAIGLTKEEIKRLQNLLLVKP